MHTNWCLDQQANNANNNNNNNNSGRPAPVYSNASKEKKIKKNK